MAPSAILRLIDLDAQLEEDARSAPEALRRRDRALGRVLEERIGDPERRIAAWLDEVRPTGTDSPGERTERVHRLLTSLLAVAGLGIGAGTAAALYRYDGTHPVNVVWVLAVFVGLQLALLCATLLLALPDALRRGVPGLGALQDAVSLASPGRWVGALRRLLPGEKRAAAERFVGMVRRHQRLYGDVEKWWLLSASQGFGVAFNLGAIATALCLVAFTDLAFGWSTTLELEASAFERTTRALSAPWAVFLPDAVPTSELIATTQYYRASHTHVPTASVGWWPFLLACMVGYGLLPRVAVLLFARWRLWAAARRAFRRLPGIAALRDRLESRLVETVAEGEEAAPTAEPGARVVPATVLEGGAPCRVVVWSGFPLGDPEEAAQQLGVEVLAVYRAGEGALDADAAALRTLAAEVGEEPVLLVVKAWEPPILELLDFVGELRTALGEGRPIVVAPLAFDADRVVAPTPRDATQWRRALDRLGDPWTTVYTPRGKGPAT